MAIVYRGERFAGYNKPKRTPKHKTKSHAVLAKKGNPTNFDLPKSFKDAFKSGDTVDAFTVMQGDTVVAIGGIHVLWEGVGEGFCMLSKSISCLYTFL